MIVYTTEHGKYFSVAESLERDAHSPRGLYINLTNRCDNDCVFCLRQTKQMAESSSLWLKREPTVEEVECELRAAPWDLIKEVVFCGFGEPTLRLSELVELLNWIKREHPTVPTRLNTNGLGELAHGRVIAPDFEGILDVASISLNASTAEKYYALTRSSYGIGAFEAMLTFAEHMKGHVPTVVLTIVDKVSAPDEIERCRQLCDARGLTLRVRPFEK
ncbi:MAG: TatD family nuclease-associated radical SAM protein [Selenomonadaceae bacterium]|nr:TatD family nuclease-associated radical SAM protein [Selenomonadaceae bacterium]